MELIIPEGWQPFLADETKKDYMFNLSSFLEAEQRAGNIIRPDPVNIFRALSLVQYDKIKVVILGQDPYHGPSQANGLAFAVNEEIKPPPSLVNIFKEVKGDLGREAGDRTLLSWASQGVLLLNTALTTRQGEAFAHRNKGWEIFTDQIIKVVGNRQLPIVFLLWGDAAQTKAKLIKKHHHIFTAPHPSPLSAHRGFIGCRHFSRTNQALLDDGLYPINWTTRGNL